MRGLIKGLIVWIILTGFLILLCFWVSGMPNVEKKPWPNGETKNPEINALKKPQKTSKVGKKLILDKSWNSGKNANKNCKNVQKSEEKKILK